MAVGRKVTINKVTPTLVFSGVGNVKISGSLIPIRFGGSAVTFADGYQHIHGSDNTMELNVGSPDELYAILDPAHPFSTTDLTVLEVR